jgi:hypothetical protein
MQTQGTSAADRNAVRSSPDFKRIVALPQREIDKDECEALSDALTPLLQTPEGKRRGVRLKPLQALALSEFADQRGAHLGLPVGEGKTLICALAPHMVGAKRAVLIVPASLKDKTYHEFHEYARDWKMPSPPARILTYHDIRNDPKLLDKIKPDLIMLDEADAARAQERSAAQRLGRYIGHCKICASILTGEARKKACKHLPMVITMTGTGTRFSITDFSHFLIWALKDRAPVPLDPKQLAKWASALDEHKPGQWGMPKRMRPGVLVDLIPQKRIAKGQAAKKQSKYLFSDDGAWGGLSDVDLAREAFQQRLRRTPGVIIVDGTACDQPLTIRHLAAPDDPEIDALFETLRSGETPDGEVITDSLAEYRLESEMGCGGYYYFDPVPPDWWRIPRKKCFRFVRAMIIESRHTARPLDTEGAVIRAFRKHPIVAAWLAVKGKFKPKSKWRWVSGSTVYAAQEWSKKHTGLIFTRQQAVGSAIAEVTGLHYYGAQGKNADKTPIEKADPTKSAVLSFNANLRGRNLQAWNRMLIVGCPQAATELEQWLGREHRYGQLRGVIADILMTSGGSLYAFEMAEREASFVFATQGQRQKILRADVKRLDGLPSESSRWVKKDMAESDD